MRRRRIRDRRRAEQVVLALAQRTPGLDADAVLIGPGHHIPLLVRRVQLDLVHGRHDTGLLHRALQMRHQEVRDADAAGEPGLTQLDQLRERVHVVVLGGGGPVHQVQVDLLQAELVEALRDGRTRLLAVVAVVPQLRRDEQLVPGDAG